MLIELIRAFVNGWKLTLVSAWVEPEFVYDFQSNYNKYSVRSKMAQFRKVNTS